MINYMNGLNTGILMNEEGFLALVLKIKTSNDQTNLFYLQGEALRDLMMVLQNRLLFLHQKIGNGQIDVSRRIESANQELANNLPVIEPKDVQQPDAGCLVSSIAVSCSEDDFKLLFIQRNGSLYHIKISDTQIQFMMVAIAKALDNVKNNDLISLLTAGINYAPVYDAIFKQDGSIDYSLIETEQWKMDLFNQYILIIYGIESKEGLELRFGAVIKTHNVVNDQEIDVIARNFASRSNKLMQYHHQLAEIKTTVMPFEKDGVPSVNEALQPLANFHKRLRVGEVLPQ